MTNNEKFVLKTFKMTIENQQLLDVVVENTNYKVQNILNLAIYKYLTKMIDEGFYKKDDKTK